MRSKAARMRCRDARKRPVRRDGLWPGARSANVIAREQSLKDCVLSRRLRASNSESWKARPGKNETLTTTRLRAS